MIPAMRLDSVQPRVLALSVVMVAAGAGTLWFTNPPVYFTNDDVAIRLALEGRAVPGQPATGFALFPNAVLGWGVVAAQRLLPAVPVWDLAVAVTLLTAIATFGSVVWMVVRDNALFRAAALIALLVSVSPLVAGLHYTVAATLGGGAGTLLVVVELAAGRSRRSMLAFGTLLVVMGMLVRPMAAMAGAAATILFLVPLLFVRAVTLRQLCGVAATALVLYFLLESIDTFMRSLSEPWAEYYRYHAIVQRLFEWGGELPVRETDRVRAAVGWSHNDWMMLQGAFGVDAAVHGLDRVSKAYDARAAIVGWGGVVRWGVERLGGIDLADVSRLLTAVSGALVAGCVLVIVPGTGRGLLIVLGVLVLFCLFCLATEVVFKELPLRVIAPLATCAVAALAVIVSALRPASSPFRSVVALGIVLAIASAEVTLAASAAAAEYRHSQQVDREVERLRALSPSLVVLHSDTFPAEHWWRPFRQPPSELRAVSLGWNNQSPALQRFLTKSAHQPLLRALCDDPSILIVGEEDRLEFVTTYLQEHFGLAAEWNDVYVGSFRAWRCSAARPAAAEEPGSSAR
jgi:hypothetical protein